MKTAKRVSIIEDIKNLLWIAVGTYLWIATPMITLQFIIRPVPVPPLFKAWWSIAFLTIGIVCVLTRRTGEKYGARFYAYGALLLAGSIITISI